MSKSSQYFEVITNYAGIDGDANYIAVKKGDVVRLIKKSKKWFTVEKDGDIGKVPKGILVQKSGKVSNDNMNQQEQTTQHIPEAKQLNDNQNNRQMKQSELEQQSQNIKSSNNSNSQINSIIPINNQKSQIISLHSNDQIKQQDENFKQQKINHKSQIELIIVKQSTVEKGILLKIFNGTINIIFINQIIQQLYLFIYFIFNFFKIFIYFFLFSKLKIAVPKQQLDQLNQIMKDIYSIIESSTINDKEIEIKIGEIFNELKKKSSYELMNIFNIDSFKLIRTYIINCTTGIEKILLDLIELVAEHGIEMYNPYYPPDPIINNMQNSGLISQIKKIILYKTKNEKKYSEQTDQLIRIYIHIMKGRQYNQQMINIYIKIIEKNINNLLNIINKLKEQLNIRTKNEQNNEETERKIQQSAQLIKVISLITENDLNNLHDRTKIPDQIMKIIKERICPLIHLNCPSNISCQQRIVIQASPAIVELKSAVLQSLNEISDYNKEIKYKLLDDHDIISHITHHLIYFASQYKFNMEIKSHKQHNYQLQDSSSSLSLINSSLDFLYNIINNNKNMYKEVIKIPNSLHSLSKLSYLQLNTHLSQQIDEQTLEIRNCSRMCIWQIQYDGNAQVQSELVSARYAGVLAIAISTASGQGEEQAKEINQGLVRIFKFLKELRKGRNDNNSSFQPLPMLAKRSEEQIEEEGGIEEIEAQLINNGEVYECFDQHDIKLQAKFAKRSMMNCFINRYSANPK